MVCYAGGQTRWHWFPFLFLKSVKVGVTEYQVKLCFTIMEEMQGNIQGESSRIKSIKPKTDYQW